MLTGTIPFPAEEQEAKLWAHISEPPPPASTTPGVPAGFDAVIARAMAKDPNQRFTSAEALGRALQSAPLRTADRGEES